MIVVLGIPPGEHYPDLPDLVADAITERSNQEIGVRVEYVHVAEPVDA